ncbi:hypothetical protein QOZ96_002466 [Brevundimonas nasdae]|uniref:hypothetical protein n=1 Tax=Brevundimonas nasdae TaxID=172043 RepID=UPI001911E52A|nr:hypothetical protein [Brevundimonas nasdae]MBK6026040.1 hypothetical protein [Brevundimonas nasdae]MDQ0452513.1 hypothetical protein [Brevundimonas nasdae]
MADTPPPSGALADFVRLIGPYVPGFAGAILSMAFGEKLTIRGKLLSVAAGMASVLWIAPAMVALAEHFWPGEGPLPVQMVGFVGFVSGTFGMVLLSGLAQAAARYSRDPLSLVRIQVGGVIITGGNREGDGS